jgi:hypothetical protein
MSTVGQVQAHQSIVRPHDSLVCLQVRGAAAQALDIDTPLLRVETEGLEGTLLAEQLNLVNVLVTAVVAGAGVSLRVLVGHGRAKGIEDGAGGDILRGDEQDGLALALELFFLRQLVVANTLEDCQTYHDLVDLGVQLDQVLVHQLS